jgi:hypothetical protein
MQLPREANLSDPNQDYILRMLLFIEYYISADRCAFMSRSFFVLIRHNGTEESITGP